MKKIIFGIIVCLGAISVNAQQDAMFTHYMYNTQAMNPAYAGTRDALTITGLHRSQWVGFDGAPTTQTLTLHSPIFNDRLGAGLSVLNDKIGPTNTTSFYADFAYRLPVSQKGTLSFGVKGGINLLSNNIANLGLEDEIDVAFQQNLSTKPLPNVGTGLYFYKDRYYVGVSTPKIIENSFEGANNNVAKEQRHYFLIAGFVQRLTDDLELKPTTFIKLTNGAPAQLDLTGTLIYNEKIWGGLMYRTGDALGLLLGTKLTDQLALGYSFDWSFGIETFKYNSGSHEIMLRYDFIYKDKEKIRSPRYF